MVRIPPPLQPGDQLWAIAPSGRLKDRELWQQGLALWQSQGFEVKISAQCEASWGYLAGTDDQRRQALWTAWTDPHCRGILCLRGGYGAARLLESWQWPPDYPKWLIGFSDVTALLWSLFQQGIASVHGPVLTTIAAEPDWSLQRLWDLLAGRDLPALQGKGWGGGRVRGPLLVGNLTVATHLLSTSYQPPLKGVILALEEVGEVPYRLDRMLTQWRALGLLDQLGGIALGRFSNCHAPEGSWTVQEVLEDRLGHLQIPIVSDLPFGHQGPNASLMVGQIVELDGDQGLLFT